MDSIEHLIAEKARRCAVDLLEQATKNEPLITKDLSEIAMEVSAETAGLENKLKSQKSLTEKLTSESLKSAKSFTGTAHLTEQAIEKLVRRQTERNNDTLRYTFILPYEDRQV